MPGNTKGITLRSIKYGDSSIISTIFTADYGVQTYIVQGVRSAKTGKNRSAFFQPGMLLDLVVYQQQQKNMQRIREYQAAYIYTTLNEDVVKNSVLLFSTELLLRLLPEHAPMKSLFGSAYDYFILLDQVKAADVANFPLYFMIQCSRELGYEPSGAYSEQTPHLNLQQGGFTSDPPPAAPFMSEEDACALNILLIASDAASISQTIMSSATRMRLTDWYIAFLQQHTQHMGNIKSLPVLRAILH